MRDNYIWKIIPLTVQKWTCENKWIMWGRGGIKIHILNVKNLWKNNMWNVYCDYSHIHFVWLLKNFKWLQIFNDILKHFLNIYSYLTCADQQPHIPLCWIFFFPIVMANNFSTCLSGIIESLCVIIILYNFFICLTGCQ